MSAPTLTVEMAMAAEPCEDYDEERVAWLLGDGKTPREIMILPIPAADIWWALACTNLLPDDALRLIAARVARSALMRERRAGREPDPRSWEAVRVADQHAKGRAGKRELNAARAAAGDAARAAARDAARAAARAAAGAAAWAASGDARAAAWAARDARDAAYKRFFKIAKRVLKPRGLWE